MIQALTVLTPVFSSIFVIRKIPTKITKSFLRVEEGKIPSQYSLVKCSKITQDNDKDDMDVIYN